MSEITIYKHPDGLGEVIFNPETKILTVLNEEAEQCTVMWLTPFGLLQIAEAMARIAKETIYGGDE